MNEQDDVKEEVIEKPKPRPEGHGNINWKGDSTIGSDSTSTGGSDDQPPHPPVPPPPS